MTHCRRGALEEGISPRAKLPPNAAMTSGQCYDAFRLGKIVADRDQFPDLAKRVGPDKDVVLKSLRHQLLENGGVLERARAMANHSSTRTTQLYDRRNDRATLDNVELIRLGYRARPVISARNGRSCCCSCC